MIIINIYIFNIYIYIYGKKKWIIFKKKYFVKLILDNIIKK